MLSGGSREPHLRRDQPDEPPPGSPARGYPRMRTEYLDDPGHYIGETVIATRVPPSTAGSATTGYALKP